MLFASLLLPHLRTQPFRQQHQGKEDPKLPMQEDREDCSMVKCMLVCYNPRFDAFYGNCLHFKRSLMMPNLCRHTLVERSAGHAAKQ